MLEEQGILIEPSAPDTQSQNGGAERSGGGVIEAKARTMRKGARLPEDLWREIYDNSNILWTSIQLIIITTIP